MKKEVRYFAQDGENIFYLSSSVWALDTLYILNLELDMLGILLSSVEGF